MFYVGQNLYDALQEMPRHPWEHVRYKHGKTVLHLAAEKGESLTAWMSIAQGASIDRRDENGRSPLHYAAQSGNLELVEMLIDAGAALNALDGEEKLPVAYAQELGHEDVVRYLTRFEKKQERPVPTLGPRQDVPPTYLWIDAICINQNDQEERGHQVRLMDRIYSEAQCVSVWLGKADPLTEHALSAVSQIARCCRKLAASSIVPYSRNDAQVFEAAGIDEISHLQWNALASLYLRKWFSRAWIIQETILARQILVWCGPHEFSFDDLCDVTEALCQRYDALDYPSSTHFAFRHTDSSSEGLLPYPTNALESLRDVDSAIEYHLNVVVKIKTSWMLNTIPLEARKNHVAWNTDRSLSLSALLIETWPFECKDPRDKIYSLLALAVSKSDSPRILPDYNRPVEKVYAQVTRYIIDKWQHLGILGNIPDSSRNKIPSLPSWVIDFSATGIAGIRGSHFNAAGSIAQRPLLTPPAHWRQLSVEGIRIGCVIEAGNVLLEGNNPQLRFDPAWYTLVASMEQIYVTGETRCDVLWRTLCSDQDVHEKYPAPIEYRDQFREVVCAIICMEGERVMGEAAATRKLAHALLRPLLQAHISSPEDAEATAQFMTAVSRTEDTPEPGIRGPYYDHIRGSLDVLEEIAKVHPNCAFPTLDQIEEFRRNSEWRLLDERGSVQMPKTDLFSNRENNFLRTAPAFHRRRLFRTENLLGLGPESLGTCDEVWILTGTGITNTPFILRPQESGIYRLIGTTYVHGVMHGEAITTDVMVQEIVLDKDLHDREGPECVFEEKTIDSE